MSDFVTISDLIVLLKNAKQDARVLYDFPAYQAPTAIDSWRGVYAEPALGHGHISYQDDEINVDFLLKELRNAIDGREYTGWKGGKYSYSGDQEIWVANPGESGNTKISGIIDKGWQVIICTKYDEV